MLKKVLNLKFNFNKRKFLFNSKNVFEVKNKFFFNFLKIS